MWIFHCYKFPLSPSKQSIYNHLWIIPSWWPGKTVPFQLPPRLGDIITLYLPNYGQNETEIKIAAWFSTGGLQELRQFISPRTMGYLPITALWGPTSTFFVHTHVDYMRQTILLWKPALEHSPRPSNDKIQAKGVFLGLSSSPGKNSHLSLGLSQRQTDRCAVKAHIINTS